MNSKSKETYSNALCYLIPLVQKAATPAMVDEGFDQAGLHPLNYGKIMHNIVNTCCTRSHLWQGIRGSVRCQSNFEPCFGISRNACELRASGVEQADPC
jgi:hypothetical protein